MKALFGLPAIVLIMALTPPALADPPAALGVQNLQTDALDQALGIDDPTPTLSWTLNGTGRGLAQTAYEIQAGTSRGATDLWDSGKVASADPQAVYKGTAPTSRRRVYWRVKVWDQAGHASGWSDAWWEMGLTATSDWSARWIGDDRWINRKPTPITVSLGGQDSRYVRIDVTKLGLPIAEGGSLLSRLQLAEIVVNDSTAPGTDLALNADVSTNEPKVYAGKWQTGYVTDGRLDSNACPCGYSSAAYKSQDPGHDIWLQLDLGAAKHFDQVVLYPRTDVMTTAGKTANFPVDYTVQTSSDGSAFTTVKTVTGQEPPPAYQLDTPALPLLAKQFSLGSDVRSARLYITALGIYDATINGHPVSDAVLEPPNTDYKTRVVYSDYDVTHLLRDGANSIGVRLGNGTYNVAPTFDRYTKYSGVQGPPKLLAQLEVTLKDGTKTTIGTDSSWRTDLGPTTYSQWYGGEDEDARKAQPGWDRPGANLSGWLPAAQAADPGIALTGRTDPPIVPVGRRDTVKVSRPVKGTYLFDLGENITGWPVLHLNGPAGTTVTVKPGERLGPDGLIDQGTMIAGGAVAPPVVDHYTLAGTGAETWHPRFVYHGFRYLQVTGLPEAPTKDTAEAVILRTGNDTAGSFSSSDLLLNDIHAIIDRSIQGNMMSILTDCPDREKLGWLEEDHLVQGSITRGYDVQAYYRELLRNMAEAQTSDGLVPDIAPEYVVFSGGVRDDPNWGSAIIMAAWQQYVTYGDTQPLSTYYPNMQKYLTYLSGKATGDLLDYGLGDWATVDKTTPTGIAATYGYYRDAATLAKIATLLGRTGDAATYQKLAGDIATAFNAKYLDTTHHTYGSGSQAGDAFALDMGVVPADQRQAVLDHLVATIKAAGDHLTVGEIALPAVFRVLSAAGRDDIILDVAQQTTSPSYGYQVVHGATALTEYWDGPTGYGSQNHFMLGAIDEWFSSGLAGIQQAADSTAYRDLVIRPAVVGDLTGANASYDTPRGTVASSWRRDGRTVRFEMTVPPGAPARVELPMYGSARPQAMPGTTWIGTENGRAVYQVGSGHWVFTVQAPGTARQRAAQVAIEPPFGTDVPIVAGHERPAEFRVTNLEDHPVTVPVTAQATGGFTATAANRVTVGAGASIRVPVTIGGSGTGGTLTVTAGDRTATIPIHTTGDLARVATMTASSVHSGSDPAWANDGGTDPAVWLNGVGGWNDGTAGEFPDTLTATWQSPVTVGRVRIYSVSPVIRDFQIQALVDGQWQTVGTVSGNTAAMVERTFAPVSASALRLVVTDSGDHNYSRVLELEAYAS